MSLLHDLSLCSTRALAEGFRLKAVLLTFATVTSRINREPLQTQFTQVRRVLHHKSL